MRCDKMDGWEKVRRKKKEISEVVFQGRVYEV